MSGARTPRACAHTCSARPALTLCALHAVARPLPGASTSFAQALAGLEAALATLKKPTPANEGEALRQVGEGGPAGKEPAQRVRVAALTAFYACCRGAGATSTGRGAEQEG